MHGQRKLSAVRLRAAGLSGGEKARGCLLLPELRRVESVRMLGLPRRSTGRRGLRCSDGEGRAGRGSRAGHRDLSGELALREREEGFLAVDAGIWHELGAVISGPGAESKEEPSG